MCVLPQSHICAAPAADARFGRGSGTTFGPGTALVRKAASCWRHVVSKVLHDAPRDDPRYPKGPPKLTFGPPWASLLEQIGERGALVRSLLFISFS